MLYQSTATDHKANVQRRRYNTTTLLPRPAYAGLVTFYLFKPHMEPNTEIDMAYHHNYRP